MIKTLIPTRRQWSRWKLPSKLTAIGTGLALLALIIPIAKWVTVTCRDVLAETLVSSGPSLLVLKKNAFACEWMIYEAKEDSATRFHTSTEVPTDLAWSANGAVAVYMSEGRAYWMEWRQNAVANDFGAMPYSEHAWEVSPIWIDAETGRPHVKLLLNLSSLTEETIRQAGGLHNPIWLTDNASSAVVLVLARSREGEWIPEEVIRTETGCDAYGIRVRATGSKDEDRMISFGQLQGDPEALLQIDPEATADIRCVDEGCGLCGGFGFLRSFGEFDAHIGIEIMSHVYSTGPIYVRLKDTGKWIRVNLGPLDQESDDEWIPLLVSGSGPMLLVYGAGEARIYDVRKPQSPIRVIQDCDGAAFLPPIIWPPTAHS